jgi:hypothetical protein
MHEVNSRQRNTIWPDILRNATRFDGFVLKGSARASLLQRLGMAFPGFVFLAFTALWAYLAITKFWALFGFVLFFGYFAWRLFRNALRH